MDQTPAAGGQLHTLNALFTGVLPTTHSGAGRAALAAWALRRLRAAEQTPGSGIPTFVPPQDLREVSNQMKMLQTVLGEIEAAEARTNV